MSNSDAPRIVIRRKKGGHAGHHGGAWKIAYADFITAMMAFFLVMWLLSLIPKEGLGTIADYFKRPLIEAVTGGTGMSEDKSLIPGKPPSLIPNINPAPSRPNAMDDNGEADERDNRRLEDLRGELEELINTDPVLRQFRPQMILDMTSEGLRIQIVDQQNRPMFQTGSAVVQPYMRNILRELGPLFNQLPNALTISGHTDATQYARGERAYSNWELSADRANAARQELIAGGMDESKVKRILGLSSTISLVQDDPYAAVNRRISLVVLNARTERRMDLESSTEEFQVDAQGNVQSLVEQAVQDVPVPGAVSAPDQAPEGPVVEEAPPNQ
ncbi:MAG: flagellar motor protein MotB [Pusillimonas sp.]